MACIYKLKDSSGNIIEFQGKEEFTDEELDLILKSIYDDINTTGEVKDLMKIFDLSPVEITDTKLEEFEQFTKTYKKEITKITGEDGDQVKMHDHPDFLGTTTFMEKYGAIGDFGKGIVDEFIESEERDRLREHLTKSKRYTSDQIETIINDTIKMYKQLTEYGTEFHAIMQATFSNTELPKFEYLTDAQVNAFKIMADAFKQKLIKAYPGAKFYAEFDIYTKDLNPDQLIHLEKLGKKGISGTIDLLVRDADGRLHIYDFKTSRKNYDDWSFGKLDHVQNQLVAYAQILRQAGLEVASLNVVPIKLDFIYTDNSESKITDLAGFEIKDVITSLKGSKPLTDTEKNWATIIKSNYTFKTDSLIETNKKVEHMIPSNLIRSIKLERDVKELEAYIEECRPVNKNSQMYQDGFRWYFIKKGLGQKDEVAYFRNEKDREDGIKQYVEDLKNYRANELDTFASRLGETIRGGMSISDLAESFSDPSFVISQFQRYIDGGWQFERDRDMNAYGIFIFKKDLRSEIVIISNQLLGTRFKLPKGTTVLGKTRANEETDSKKHLESTTGNLELMRAMTYIAENQELFKEYKITQVRVINPWMGKQTSAPNSVLAYNYNLLVQDNSETFDGNLRYLPNDIFYGDLTSMLSIADDLIRLESDFGLHGFTRDGIEDYDGKISEFTAEWIEERIKWLRRTYNLYDPNDITNGNQNAWMAYRYLMDALQAIYGFRTVQEYDKKAWLAGGSTPGVYIASTSYSPSANIRQFDDVISMYATEVRQEVEKLGRKLVEPLQKYYNSKGQIKILGGEANYFIDWFNKNPDGSLHDSFTLKSPDDSEFENAPEARAALTAWLETMAKLRWPKITDEELELKKADRYGEYYQVPLMEARFIRQARALGKHGVFKALKNKIDQYRLLTTEVFAGKEEDKQKWDREVVTNNWSKGLYNKMNPSQTERKKLISDKGIGFFETDLEAVMNMALVSFTKSAVSKKYIPILSAMQISLKIGESLGEQKQEAVEKALDKLIRTKFYNENYLENDDSGLPELARWLNVTKHALSAMALGFNPRSFAREFLQGTWMGISRAKLNNVPGIDAKTYAAAYEHVLFHAHENFSSVSKLQQLDARFGIANYSLNNISRKRRLNWFGIRNVSSDTLFWGSTAPDFQHRVTMVVAKMMGDGVWDAYTMNEDGDLIYNWKEDERFKIYYQNLVNDPKYYEQKALYERHIMELNHAGRRFKTESGVEREYQIGDPLPEAYLPKEIQALKNYADLLYGHYDDESRSLVNDMFLGAFFMQYKTYIVSRIEQWTMAPGIYNTELLEWETDPITGKHLYKVLEGWDENRPEISIVSEDKLENIEQLLKEGKIEPLYVWKGMPMEGILRSYIDFFKQIKSLNWEGVKEILNNPMKKANLMLGLHDCVWASLMILLITGLFGLLLDGEWTTDTSKVARSARKAGWGHSFAFNIAYGSFTDFPIWSSIQSMLGDWNPPAWTSAKRLVENTGAVILGNKTLFQAVTNTVGAAADLKGWADALAEN